MRLYSAVGPAITQTLTTTLGQKEHQKGWNQGQKKCQKGPKIDSSPSLRIKGRGEIHLIREILQ